MKTHDSTQSVLLCVFDGHGRYGHKVSKFFSDGLPDTLFKHPKFSTNIEAAIQESTAALEEKLNDDTSGIDTQYSGTTAVITVTRGNTIIVGNIGDSRITLGSTKPTKQRDSTGEMDAKALSRDHTPGSFHEGNDGEQSEYDRIFDNMDKIHNDRVYLRTDTSFQHGLGVSRSLGDTYFHNGSVISTPEFTRHSFTDSNKFLVLASDGLWDCLTDQEVINHIAAENNTPEVSVQTLIARADALWKTKTNDTEIDDTTIIVAHLAKPAAAIAAAAAAAAAATTATATATAAAATAAAAPAPALNTL